MVSGGGAAGAGAGAGTAGANSGTGAGCATWLGITGVWPGWAAGRPSAGCSPPARSPARQRRRRRSRSTRCRRAGTACGPRPRRTRRARAPRLRRNTPARPSTPRVRCIDGRHLGGDARHLRDRTCRQLRISAARGGRRPDPASRPDRRWTPRSAGACADASAAPRASASSGSSGALTGRATRFSRCAFTSCRVDAGADDEHALRAAIPADSTDSAISVRTAIASALCRSRLSTLTTDPSSVWTTDRVAVSLSMNSSAVVS